MLSFQNIRDNASHFNPHSSNNSHHTYMEKSLLPRQSSILTPQFTASQKIVSESKARGLKRTTQWQHALIAMVKKHSKRYHRGEAGSKHNKHKNAGTPTTGRQDDLAKENERTWGFIHIDNETQVQLIGVGPGKYTSRKHWGTGSDLKQEKKLSITKWNRKYCKLKRKDKTWQTVSVSNSESQAGAAVCWCWLCDNVFVDFHNAQLYKTVQSP